MKKNLAKAVVLGLVCANVLPGGIAGAEDITSSNSFDTIELISTDNNPALNIVGNAGTNDIVIDFAKKNTVTKLMNRTGNIIVNSAANQKVNIKGNDLMLEGALQGNAIKNNVNTDLNFDASVNIMMGAVSNQNIIHNEGKLNFNNLLNLTGTVSDSDIINTNAIYNDTGAVMNINSAVRLQMLAMDENYNYSNKSTVAIRNNGTLFINNTQVPDTLAEGDVNYTYIGGDIYHGNGAITNISLKGSNAQFMGKIVGSDSNFKLSISDGATWYVGNNQADYVVEGLELNGGNIYTFDVYNLGNYRQLTLHNFTSNGVFNDGQGFFISTDIANDQGDKIKFIGSTPNVTIPVYIIDKVFESEEISPIVTPEDGHSVTIVETPWDSAMKINAISKYGDGNKVYDAVIEDFSEGGTKYYNFLGWGETDKTRDKNDLKKVQQIDHHILVEDLDENLKRLNDIRTDPSEVGVWIRGEKGDTKIRNYKYEYNLMSGGYDWHNENDARKLFYGFGITYSTNDCDDNVIGDTKSLGYNLYGSWLGKKNNDYVDVVLKWGTLDKDYAGLDRNGVFVKGDYDKDLFAIAAKYGRRIFVDDSFYYEPQIGYTYGRVGSADFIDNQNTHINADSTNSHIASLGVQVGKNIKGTEVYGKLAYVYDFDGNIHVSAPGISADDDMGGGYMQVAIGASRKIDKDNSFYIDIEKDFGNKVKKPYAFSIGYRHTF